MRKPRDYDAELRSLGEKARQLKNRKHSQLGELVAACGADQLTSEELAGALLEIAAAVTATPARKEAWRKAGAAFFSRAGESRSGRRAESDGGSAAPVPGSTQPPVADADTP